jgi:PDZ domain-containing protein
MLGDVITAVDGAPVTANDTIRPLLLAHRPGERVRVTVDRGGSSREVTVLLGRREGSAYLGIATQTVIDERFPFNVEIDTRRVSGPSAGLAFTLAVIDVLTPGDLTGDQRVAVTGSISPDGTVGQVGGVEQKTVTARERGVTLLLVPKGEARDARPHAGLMRVIAVATIDDALAALERFGGDPVAPSTAAQDAQ